MNSQKIRNGKLDFMKFLFSLVIVVHHGRNLMGDEGSLFLGGSFAVEFFFIVSGYLMLASIKKMPEHPGGGITGAETLNFIKHKYKALCPEIFVAYIVALIFCVVATDKPLIDTFLKTFFEGIMLRMFGFHTQSINGAVWYISSMLLGMAILFPLLRRYPDMAENVVVPLGTLLILGYFCGNETSPRNPTLWMGWTYKGNLRAIAELGIGIIAYRFVEKIRTIKFTVAGQSLLTAIEYLCYMVIFYYMYAKVASRRDYFFLIVLTVAIIITLSHQGIDAKWFDNKICAFLGRYSLALYLSHTYYAEHIGKFLPVSYTYEQRMVVYIPCAMITALVVMTISHLLRAFGPYLLRKIKRIIIQPI